MSYHVTYLLAAYVHGELPPHLRERVSRHVQQCDACYAALVRERELNRTLQDGLRGMGAPRSEQLARLLPGILAESAPPRPAHRARRPGLGLAVGLSMLLILLMPALVMPRVSAIASPQDQPSPQVRVTATHNVTDAPVHGLPVHVIASPTVVAVQLVVMTQPPLLNPSPAPVLQATPGG
ncbi:MAG: zf-HC2 domain-containing protein [Anaerolineae bacterium]|nr:zf-HC2 domain-containing protein [Anaerolineae bacterium]